MVALIFDSMKYRNKETKNKGSQEGKVPLNLGWTLRNTDGQGRRAGGRRSDEGKVENELLEGRWRGVEAENGCAQLYAFTRIYRLLSLVSGRTAFNHG